MVAIRNVLPFMGPLAVLTDASYTPDLPSQTHTAERDRVPQLSPQWSTVGPLSPELDRQLESAKAAEAIARWRGWELLRRQDSSNETETLTATRTRTRSVITSTRTIQSTETSPPTTISTRTRTRTTSSSTFTPISFPPSISTRTRTPANNPPPPPPTTPATTAPSHTNQGNTNLNQAGTSTESSSLSSSETLSEPSSRPWSFPSSEPSADSTTRSADSTESETQDPTPTTTPKPTSTTVLQTTTLPNGEQSTFTSVKVITPSILAQTTEVPPSLQSDGAGSVVGRNVGREAAAVIGGALGVAYFW